MILEGLPEDAADDLVCAILAAIGAFQRGLQPAPPVAPRSWAQASLHEAATGDRVQTRSDLVAMQL